MSFSVQRNQRACCREEVKRRCSSLGMKLQSYWQWVEKFTFTSELSITHKQSPESWRSNHPEHHRNKLSGTEALVCSRWSQTHEVRTMLPYALYVTLEAFIRLYSILEPGVVWSNSYSMVLAGDQPVVCSVRDSCRSFQDLDPTVSHHRSSVPWLTWWPLAWTWLAS